MSKILKTLGIVFLVLVAGFVGLLIWAQRSGAAHQRKFFEAVLSGDPKQVTALFHPALVKEVDEPVLAAWMAAVKADLGSFKGLSASDFSTSTKYEDGAKITESKGKVEFEKGEAQADLTYRDEKLIAFHIVSERIPKDWFKGPVGTELYRERGKEFLTLFLNGQADQAFAMMHESLQKQAPLEKLKAMIASVTAKAGALKAIAYQSESLETSGRLSLKILYTADCEKASLPGYARFEFDGLRGYLLGFNLGKQEGE